LPNSLFKRSILLFSAILILPVFTWAQSDWGCINPSKKAEKNYNEGMKYRMKSKASYENLLKAVEANPKYAEALSVLAYINNEKYQSNTYSNVRQGNRAKQYWEKSIQACEAFRNYEATFFLAKFHYDLKEYEEASKYLSQYLSKA